MFLASHIDGSLPPPHRCGFKLKCAIDTVSNREEMMVYPHLSKFIISVFKFLKIWG
jgi:hypothetical protein